MTKVIKGYTLIEIVIALVLSTICISFVYSGVLFFEKIVSNFINQQQTVYTINRLDRDLITKFKDCNKVSFLENHLIFEFENKVNSVYIFNDESIQIENNGVWDTIMVKGVFNMEETIGVEDQGQLMVLPNNILFVYCTEYCAYNKFNK